MEILPAIDIRGGRVVRLARGDYDAQTVYSDDPVSVAKDFVAAGAKWIHMVDLDAALSGEVTNAASVKAVADAVDAKIELGGGARDQAAITAMLENGASRVVVGSAAVKNFEWFAQLLTDDSLAGKLALGLDARDGKLAAQGWTEQLETTAVELARRVSGSKLGAIVYTDIARDGMLTGVNIDATKQMVQATDVPIIASGGVAGIEDIRQCRLAGCAGAIVGKAYYEGRINLSDAIAESQAD